MGAASRPEVREAIEGADVLITVGVFFTDLISGFFSQHLEESRRIDLLPHRAVVAGTVFDDVEMSDALDALTGLVTPPEAVAFSSRDVWSPAAEPGDGPLSQDELWTAVAGALRPGDVVIADQGTSFYGMGRQRVAHDTVFIGQPLWASIGFTLPAVLGAAMAAPSRRPVLLIGDGAAQLTIGELGTLIRYRIPALIVLVNNDGYTVERAIHGPDKRYNDIAAWRWTELPHALGGDGNTAYGVRVETAKELVAALSSAPGDRLTLIEAVTPALDVPSLLSAVAEAAAGANR